MIFLEESNMSEGIYKAKESVIIANYLQNFVDY